MKKPVPVKIVEVLGWVYVALSFLAVISVIVLVFKKPSEWPSIIFAFTPVSLTVGMVMSLRRGRRAWFLWPNALLTSFVMMVAVFSVSKLALLWGVLSLILLVAPIVLLHIKSAKRWFNEMSGDERPIRFGVSIFLVAVFAIVILPVTLEVLHSKKISDAVAARNRLCLVGRDILLHMIENRQAYEEGRDWVNPASYTNSAQFVRALFEKAGKEWKYPDYCLEVWSIAVNPPADDSFPLLITSNVNPRELLFPKDAGSALLFTCPKAWGGTCFEFCEKAAVVVRQGGAALFVKLRYARRPHIIFPNGVPKLGVDTYYLTPTGRIDLVSSEQEKTLKAHFKENKGRTLP